MNYMENRWTGEGHVIKWKEDGIWIDQKLEGGPVLNLTQGMGGVLIQARLGKAAPS